MPIVDGIPRPNSDVDSMHVPSLHHLPDPSFTRDSRTTVLLRALHMHMHVSHAHLPRLQLPSLRPRQGAGKMLISVRVVCFTQTIWSARQGSGSALVYRPTGAGPLEKSLEIRLLERKLNAFQGSHPTS
jgi:hypothetical protein